VEPIFVLRGDPTHLYGSMTAGFRGTAPVDHRNFVSRPFLFDGETSQRPPAHSSPAPPTLVPDRHPVNTDLAGAVEVRDRRRILPAKKSCYSSNLPTDIFTVITLN